MSSPAILIVDDDDAALERLTSLFAANGFRVLPARRCREALEAARHDVPDLVLATLLGSAASRSDGGANAAAENAGETFEDGFAFCWHWQNDELLRHVPFAFFADPCDLRLARRIGADCIFVRSMEPAALVAQVREAIAQRPIRPTRAEVDAGLEAALDSAALERHRQTEKMEALARLAGGVAHAFNNSLTVISGFGQLLLNALDVNDSLHGLAIEIERSVEKAAELTRQLLLFGRRAIRPGASADLNAVACGLERLLQRTVGDRVEVRLALAEGLGRVQCDEAQIEQVLLSLAERARDAMAQGGTLTIASFDHKPDARLQHDYPQLRQGRFIELRVVDSGIAIAPDVLPHIFEPFYAPRETGKGFGLQMATVYGIVTHAGGLVLVDSEPSRGTTVRVLLPCESAAETPAGPRSAPPAPMPGGSETILVVDDDAGVRVVVADMLSRLGYRPLPASSGSEAATLIQREKAEPPHLLITDVVMPGMSGPELAEQLRGILPGLRVLFISGFTGDTLVSRGVVADGLGFLAKPFTAAALAVRVRQLFDGVPEKHP